LKNKAATVTPEDWIASLVAALNGWSSVSAFKSLKSDKSRTQNKQRWQVYIKRRKCRVQVVQQSWVCAQDPWRRS
jgi:hypothetical protein